MKAYPSSLTNKLSPYKAMHHKAVMRALFNELLRIKVNPTVVYTTYEESDLVDVMAPPLVTSELYVGAASIKPLLYGIVEEDIWDPGMAAIDSEILGYEVEYPWHWFSPAPLDTANDHFQIIRQLELVNFTAACTRLEIVHDDNNYHVSGRGVVNLKHAYGTTTAGDLAVLLENTRGSMPHKWPTALDTLLPLVEESTYARNLVHWLLYLDEANGTNISAEFVRMVQERKFDGKLFRPFTFRKP